MQEIWKDVEDYEGLYQVSNLGRVKSSVRQGTQGGVLKFKINNKGYYYVGLSKDNVVKCIKIHRLVAGAFILNPDNKPQVNHKDGIKIHNEDYNLEWVTNSENQKHFYNKLGRASLKNENNGNAKLSNV